jgi:hypothetical protein
MLSETNMPSDYSYPLSRQIQISVLFLTVHYIVHDIWIVNSEIAPFESVWQLLHTDGVFPRGVTHVPVELV